ncbi:hypothetical protein BHU72_03840 [Desulfuribacillus stibiiarsenatis]|uniref:DUF2062 domain-containing protein n=1 Tax=Desulfuribacillus stibiiarsenatis TaxID=1390249 RepID=A0A1E5L7B8_9FIRM|nr:DUF2062 domain-containing protein [Desulfuribacillus stibiiarsenatis]OEH85914.1 hypothetical protein BHU72_03840 [Desulfuribacillus stibiiarsenatis]
MLQWMKKFYLYYAIRLLRIKGSDEKIARGFSLGMIVNFFPTFGFGVLISPVFARIFGGNPIAGLIGGASLTFFWAFLFYLNFSVGNFILNINAPLQTYDELDETLIHTINPGTSFFVGAMINCIFFGGAIYLILYFFLKRYRVIYFERIKIAIGKLNFIRRKK